MTQFLKAAKSLAKLGSTFIEKEGIKSFHVYAQDLLGEAQLDSLYDYKALVQDAFKSDSIQNYKFLEFSDLPLTIAREKNCFIDLYFWRRRPTVIHNHHFMGAFQCLEGINVDLEFTYKRERRLGKYHHLGELELVDSREMKAGDIAAINFQDKFIHQNHHQADLTVNLCFRTPDVEKSHISNFLFSGLRFEKSPVLLGRVQRLIKFAGIGDFDLKTLPLSLDDALYFLLTTEGSSSQNPRFLGLRSFLDKKVKKELKVDMKELIEEHDRELDKMIELYD